LSSVSFDPMATCPGGLILHADRTVARGDVSRSAASANIWDRLPRIQRCEMWRISFGLLVFAFVVPSCSSITYHAASGCDRAMHALAKLDLSTPDSVMGSAQDATLTACGTKTAWLAAAQKYRSSGLHHCVLCGNATGDVVLAELCLGHNAGKPACR